MNVLIENHIDKTGLIYKHFIIISSQQKKALHITKPNASKVVSINEAMQYINDKEYNFIGEINS